MNKVLFTTLLSLLFISVAQAGELYEEFPSEIKANEKYVFYSHGFIVEGNNPTPINPRWGKYEFPQIKAALADESYNLVAYHRAKGTDPREFAKKLIKDINILVNRGVLYENITFIGFSRGGAITALVSHYAKSKKLNIIILAGCGNFMRNNPEVDLYGHIYSIYETSDGVGSCQYVIDRSKQVTSFTEIAISTGKEHGAFYTPIDEWLLPVKNWLKAQP